MGKIPYMNRFLMAAMLLNPIWNLPFRIGFFEYEDG